MKSVAAILIAAPILLGLQQPAQSRAAQIAGVVFEEGSSPERPVRRAIVTLTGTGLAVPMQVLTDESGRFTFGNLASGRFSLTAEKPAYLKTYYGSTRIGRPPGMPIAIAAGENQSALRVPLMKGAAIGGTVRETTGVPVSGAQVQVRMVTIANGARKLTTPFAGTTLVVTNDLGEYRVWGLPPGEYVLRVGGGGASGSGSARTPTANEISAAQQNLSGSGALPQALQPLLAPTPPPQTSRLFSYAPGVLDASQATGVTVSAGEERGGIDIVSLIGPVATVAGVAFGPGGEPLQNILIGLANLSTQSMFYSPGGIRPNAGGTFGIGGLTPGRWLFYGRGAPVGVPSDGQFPWWAETEFTVAEGGTVNVVLQFAPGSVVTGRLDFNGSAPPPDLTKLRVSLQYLEPVDGMSASVPSVQPAADGSFIFPVVPPGRYRAAVSAAGAWALQSAKSQDRDILDTPLEIATGQNASLVMTMTDRPTEISGTLLDRLGRPAPEYSVVVFSADRAEWGIPRRSSGIVKLASDGTYNIIGLPAGRYVLCVVTDADPSSLSDPSFLEQLSAIGVPLTLAEGEKKRQDFKIGG